MQNIPVDAGKLGRAMVFVPPEPRTNPETGEVRKDREGNPVYTVGIAVRQDGRRASIIEVSVSGEPQGLAEGATVKFVNLEAFSWAMGDRHGISFRAAAILPATAPAAPASAGGSAGGKGGEGR